MSRCAPFPSPGFVWNGLSGDSLIEFIKVRKEMAETEKQKKKEERRRRRKDQKQEDWQKRRRPCSNPNDNKKGEVDELRWPEWSSLTEEFGQPTTSDSPFDSTDNSQNIVKRRKLGPSSSWQNHGSASPSPKIRMASARLEFESENLEWLGPPSGGKRRHGGPTSEVAEDRNSKTLSEADIYALPYVSIF